MKEWSRNIKDTIINRRHSTYSYVIEVIETENGRETIVKKIMIKNFPKFVKDINLYIKKTQLYKAV